MQNSIRQPLINILIVDDHPIAREGLMAMLTRQKDFRVVGEAEDGLQAIVRYDQLKPDIVLLDLRMPRMNGHDTIAQLMTRSPKPRIIVITTYEGDEDVRRALEKGAIGYLLKDASRQVVWDAIRKVHAGQSILTPELFNSVTDAFSKPTLTEREDLVLKLIAEKSLSNKLIAYELGITEATVKTHIRNLYEKLGVRSRTQAINIATRRGLVHLGS
jgi:DNA-binding NarL/FixJ family response regulator